MAVQALGATPLVGPAPVMTRPGEVVVKGDGTPFGQDVYVGRHKLKADEPSGVGGNDSGPSPFDYLLAGAGACKSMTMKMYAARKQIPLTGVEVRLSLSRVPGGRDRIDTAIKLDGPLTDEQRKRLIEIADRCAVHKTLSAGIDIESHESR